MSLKDIWIQRKRSGKVHWPRKIRNRVFIHSIPNGLGTWEKHIKHINLLSQRSPTEKTDPSTILRSSMPMNPIILMFSAEKSVSSNLPRERVRGFVSIHIFLSPLPTGGGSS